MYFCRLVLFCCKYNKKSETVQNSCCCRNVTASAFNFYVVYLWYVLIKKQKTDKNPQRVHLLNIDVFHVFLPIFYWPCYFFQLSIHRFSGIMTWWKTIILIVKYRLVHIVIYVSGGIYLQGYIVREQPYGSKKSTIELKPPSEEFKTFYLCAENPNENKRWATQSQSSFLPLFLKIWDFGKDFLCIFTVFYETNQWLITPDTQWHLIFTLHFYIYYHIYLIFCHTDILWTYTVFPLAQYSLI